MLEEDIARKKLQQQLLEGYYKDSEERMSAELDAKYQENIATMQDALERAAESSRHEYVLNIEKYKQDYLATLKSLTENLNHTLEEKKVEISKAEETLADLQDKVNAATEVDKRALEIREQADFYKLQISDQDLHEIQELKKIIPFLRDQEPLNKVIWKVYYEQPYTALVGRVVGATIKTGIYKITNLQNGMCYVGQSTNIAERWRQHIKRGLGAETPTHNKLYPAMGAIGVENFSFEIIEECDRSSLNEREQYWQDFYNAKTFGYSIK